MELPELAKKSAFHDIDEDVKNLMKFNWSKDLVLNAI